MPHQPFTIVHAPELSRRATEMPASSIRRIFNASLELEAQGKRVIKLHIGDPDLPTPDRIKAAVSAAMAGGHTRYSAMIGLLELRRAIAGQLIGRFGIRAEQMPARQAYPVPVPGRDALEDSVCARVVVNQGATQALNSAMQACCDSGSTLLLPEIYFPNYIQQVTLAGVRPLFYPLGGDFQPLVDNLDELINSAPPGSIKAMLVNSPGNPTGAVFTAATMRAIYEFAERHNLWIIADEAYTHYVFEGETLPLLSIDLERHEESRRVISVFSFGKSYAVTGLRLGYSVSPRPEVTQRLALMNEPLTGSLTTPLQHGMIAALSVDDTAERREELRTRWKESGEMLRAAGLAVPRTGGGIFQFADVSATGMDSDEFADRLLAEEQVAVVPGSGFGLVPQRIAGGTTFVANERARRCVRICFAVAETELREGIARIAAFVARYRTA
jgi:aspartate aminotransferase